MLPSSNFSHLPVTQTADLTLPFTSGPLYSLYIYIHQTALNMIYGSYKLYKKWEKHHDKKKAEKEEHEHQQQQLYGQISDPDLDPRYAVRHRSRSPALRMTAQQRHGPIGYGLLGNPFLFLLQTAMLFPRVARNVNERSLAQV